MTQAFNLAQLANNLNTSGQLDATDGLTGLVTNANLASSGTASSSTFLRGDRTWASIGNVGKVLQVQSTTVNTSSTYSSGVQAVTGLSVSITPSATTSKIWICVNLSCSNGTASGSGWMVYRNGSVLSGMVGASAGSRRLTTAAGTYNGGSDPSSERMQGNNYLDSPATTSTLTYAVYLNTNGANNYVNQSQNDGDSADRTRSISTITVFEIGA